MPDIIVTKIIKDDGTKICFGSITFSQEDWYFVSEIMYKFDGKLIY